jgi:hypothetical protein
LTPEYHPDYYGAFAIDPDGNNMEAVCHAVRQGFIAAARPGFGRAGLA